MIQRICQDISAQNLQEIFTMNNGKLSFKDKLYFYFAEKNWGVRREYGPYVDANRSEHENAE